MVSNEPVQKYVLSASRGLAPSSSSPSLSFDRNRSMLQALPWDLGRIWREKRGVLCVISTSLCVLMIMSSTPAIPHSPDHHIFADRRNLLGIHNTLNVITNFPFLLVGVVGFVFSIGGNFFCIKTKSEVLGWTLFYGGVVGLAFGSAYYHLNPNDDRAIFDRLPIMVSISSLLSIITIERIDFRFGFYGLFSLLMLVFFGIQHERTFDDLRLCIIVQFVECVAIPVILLLFQPKYSHSRYWFLATGLYLLSRFETIYDNKVYKVSQYTISGHSLGHLCLAGVPVLLALMLCLRNTKIER